ncbi:MAG: hypothetical protein AABX82_06525 [Nanoarchaeota archaeon]
MVFLGSLNNNRYSLEVMVNTLVLTGGNWQGETTPLAVLERERKEELRIGDEVLGLQFSPGGYFFTGIPEKTIRQEGRKGYCDLCTIFVGEVDEEQFFDVLHDATVFEK